MSDPFFSSVSLLCHFDGADGATTTTDTSGTPKTITLASGAALSTAAFQFGTASLSAGTGTASVTTGTDLAMGSGDFTYEGWFRRSGAGTNYILTHSASGSHDGVEILATSGGALRAWVSSGAFGDISGGSVSTSTWYHFAYVRNGNNFMLFLDGTQVGSTVTSSNSVPAIDTLWLGNFNGSSPANRVDEIRITKGVARYTSNFTAPTAPFDDNTTGVALTGVSATGSVGTVSPPPKLAAVSGSGSAGTVAAARTVALTGTSATTSAGTISSAHTQAVTANTATGSPGTIAPAQGVPLTAATATASPGSVSASSAGAATLTGVSATASPGTLVATPAKAITGGTATGSPGSVVAAPARTPTAVSAAASTGTVAPSRTVALSGVSGTSSVGTIGAARIVTAAQQMDAFAQSAAIVSTGDPYFASVVLLLHCDGANNGTAFTDSSAAAHTVTVLGDAITSTSTPKFGTASLFIPTDGGLNADHASDFNFGSGDFTVEGWGYTTAETTAMYLFRGLAAATTNTAAGPAVSIVGGQLRGVCTDSGGGGFGSITAGTIPSSAWFHWAYCRVGSGFRLFLNGLQVGSTVSSSAACGPAGRAMVGTDVYGTFGVQWTGFIDDVRVTRGTGRYTTSFTAPTVAFPDFGGLATLSAAAAQALGAFTQAATAYGAGSRTMSAAQSIPAFAQTYWVSAPSRIVASSTTFVFGQTGAVITTADRNLVTPGDVYYQNTAYLLHGDSSMLTGTDYAHPNVAPTSLTVGGKISPSSSDSLAFGGKAIAFAAAAGSWIAQFGGLDVPDRTISTTEMRVRFDTLTGIVPVTPVSGSPGEYTFDPDLQQTGWFFTSGDGGAGMKLGLAGYGGLYEADWTHITASGTSITFAPYVLQIKGIIENYVTGVPYVVNAHGTHEVTVGWHDVAVVRNGLSVSVYLDGVFDFSFSLPDPLADYVTYFFDERFRAGGDVTLGFAFQSSHTNLSAIEELRHTWGIARYSGNYMPATAAFPHAQMGQLPALAQLAGVVHATATRLAAAAQTMGVFGQAATVYGAGIRAVAGAQTMAGFDQAATLSGQPIRVLSAIQVTGPFAQVASVSEPREIGGDWNWHFMDPFGQGATAVVKSAAQAAQTVSFTHNATAVHAPDGTQSDQTFAFGQVATAKALLALTQGQIVLPFGQAGSCVAVVKVSGAQQIRGFTTSSLIQGAFISASARGFRVVPEDRVFTPTFT